MRLFVAIAPEPRVRQELETRVAPLRPAWPALRWTGQQAWHVTLAFLGEVDEAVVPRLAERLGRAAGKHPRLELSAAGAGAFPTVPRARVLWTGVRGDPDALRKMSGSVAKGATKAGAPPPGERRRFRPHITLARSRQPADFRPLITALADYSGPAWMADRIHLIRSYLGPLPRYESLGDWPLGVRASRLGSIE
jgi:RNA 2',3'-cyclic 3'-phosphodiesterase